MRMYKATFALVVHSPPGGTRISSDGNDRFGAKNQNPKKSLGFSTKPQKIRGPKVNPPKIP